ncbi:MAG: hypothetical protein R2762_22535 [Bryobacteraceae bacterium]
MANRRTMLYRSLLLAALCAASAAAQSVQLVCDATADPRQIRLEGVTETLGEIVIVCTGTPGVTVAGSLTLNVSALVTNRVDDDGRIDAVLVADTASGALNVGGRPLLLGRNTIAFQGYSFVLPASGLTSFKITNLLVDPSLRTENVRVAFTTSGQTGLAIRNNPVIAGVPLPGLLVNGSTGRIVCTGSPLPDESNFSGFLNAGTRFATIRVTEGSPAAFEARRPNATHGVRIRVRLSGFPAQARVFVPDRIAGDSAAGQTSAGDPVSSERRLLPARHLGRFSTSRVSGRHPGRHRRIRPGGFLRSWNLPAHLHQRSRAEPRRRLRHLRNGRFQLERLRERAHPLVDLPACQLRARRSRRPGGSFLRTHRRRRSHRRPAYPPIPLRAAWK